MVVLVLVFSLVRVLLYILGSSWAFDCLYTYWNYDLLYSYVPWGIGCYFPVSGAFVTYNNRFIDPSWGFAMAWNYAMQWLVVLPLELVAAAMTVKYWDAKTNLAAFVVIFYVLIVAINFFGVRGYGEAELYLVPLKFWLFWVSLFWVLYCVLVVVHKVVTLAVKLVY